MIRTSQSDEGHVVVVLDRDLAEAIGSALRYLSEFHSLGLAEALSADQLRIVGEAVHAEAVSIPTATETVIETPADRERAIETVVEEMDTPEKERHRALYALGSDIVAHLATLRIVGYEGPLDRLDSLYDSVAETIRWDGQFRSGAQDSPDADEQGITAEAMEVFATLEEAVAIMETPEINDA